MKFNLILILGVLLSFVNLTIAQEFKIIEKIKGIKILTSTRFDLRKAFGEAKNNDYPYTESFYLKEGEIFAEYSEGLCGENNKKGWNVSEWIVTRIWFTPKNPIAPQNLKIDFTGFKKSSVNDVPGAWEYDNEKLGVSYSVTTKGKISLLDFYPSSKYNYLDCEEMASEK